MDPATLSCRAPAKINLFLLITGRRADGYHLLDSLVVFAGAHDRLHAAAADEISLGFGGAFGANLAAEADNLVLRAARGLASATGISIGARLHLEKNLPIASGIGGGSSDAAAALRLLSHLWGVSVPEGLAATLGADVPVCLDPRPLRMGGIGEELRPGQSGRGLADRACIRRPPGGVFDAGAAAGWLDGCWRHGRRSGRLGERSGGARHRPVPADRSGSGWLARAARLPSGPHERLRRHLFRPVRQLAPGGVGSHGAVAYRLVVLGWGTLRPGRRDLMTGRIGASPSGKAVDFDSTMRRFESSRPSQHGLFGFNSIA